MSAAGERESFIVILVFILENVNRDVLFARTIQFDSRCVCQRDRAKAANDAGMKFYLIPDRHLKFARWACAVGSLRHTRSSDFTTRSAVANFFRRAAATSRGCVPQDMQKVRRLVYVEHELSL